MVKKYPGGMQSTYLHAMQPGDTLYFAGPLPGFKWAPNKHPHVGLIAGGAGITPMLSLLKGILANPADRTRVTLVWGVNTDADIFLADELAALKEKHPDQFDVHYVVSQPVEGSQYPKGYVSKELLERAGLAKNANTKLLLCGPPAMESAMVGKKGFGTAGKKGVFEELGYNTAGDIHRF